MSREQLGDAPYRPEDTVTVAWANARLNTKIDGTPDGKLAASSIEATGTPDAFNFLSGDGKWGHPHPHVLSISSSTTPTVNVEVFDALVITSLNTDITGWHLVGEPGEEWRFMMRVTDDGFGPYALSWPEDLFIPSRVADFPSATVAGRTHRIGLMYDAIKQRWVCMAADQNGY